MTQYIYSIIAILTLSFSTLAQDQKPVVSVLGMMHLHNPGADAVNMDMGNIYSDKRQAELKELIQLLTTFKPTKIAIEKPLGDTLWTQTYYVDYLNGVLEEKVKQEHKWVMPSEVVQLSYPLAKKMKHTQLYAIDAFTDFEIDPVLEYAKEHQQTEELEAFQAMVDKMQTDITTLSKGSVLEILKFVNSEKFDKQYNQNFYLKHLVSFGKETEYIGTKVVADWYFRNLKIFTNLQRIAKPNDRILVIYGAGHKDILVDLIKDRVDWQYQDIATILNSGK